MHSSEELRLLTSLPSLTWTEQLPRTVDVDGTPIRFEVSGESDRTLVLLHGHQANHVWWHRVAPILERDWRIVRMDFSGHGDSGHRDAYTGGTWADEVHAVVAASGAADVVLVGHSMGGRIALAAAAARPEGVLGVITLDSALRSSTPLTQFAWHPERRPRVRATRTEALGRFRLAPDQPAPADDIMAAVAASSIRQESGGWTWKYDQRGIPGVTRQEVEDRLPGLSTPVRYVHAEHSLVVDDEAIELLRATLPPDAVEIIEMAGVHHHLVLEAPERCARLIDELASQLVR